VDDGEDVVEKNEDEEINDINLRVVRIRISNNFLIKLLNSGVNLTVGVDQIFY